MSDINSYFGKSDRFLNSDFIFHFQGAASLKVLLNVALQSIPSSHWSTTPVALKATAGLRLIPEKKAKALLDEVSITFIRHSVTLTKRNYIL